MFATRLRLYAAGIPRLRIATLALLSLPALLMYARAGAEIAIGVIDILFLLEIATAGGTRFPRGGFAMAAIAWWLWQVLASAIGTGGIALALVAIRLPLLSLALRHWLLQPPRTAPYLRGILALCVAWIILECWQQQLTGHNIFGQARWQDGALTGPFNRPRSGPELILLLFPVMLPLLARGLETKALWRRLATGALAALSAATVLLIGQRMPSALLILGTALTGLLLPRIRVAAAGIAVLAALLLAAMPVVAPAAYDKLVVHTSDQLHHFTETSYGEIWVRAAVIARHNPWHGVGTNGFRRVCNSPAYVQGLPEIGVTTQDAKAAIEACNIHPHNYYLEAADDGGVPLLLLFSVMVIAALATLAAGLRRHPEAARAGLFIGATIAFFPIASTSSFTAMPNAGWIFLLLGTGFAAADAARKSAVQGSPPAR
jgi:hypothetical protein